jgi:hypothetical protein
MDRYGHGQQCTLSPISIIGLLARGLDDGVLLMVDGRVQNLWQLQYYSSSLCRCCVFIISRLLMHLQTVCKMCYLWFPLTFGNLEK